MFDLVKWYADAVSADGAFLIGYCARLRFRRFCLAYSSVLDSQGCRQSLRDSEMSVAPGEARWRAPALGIDLRWPRAGTEIKRTIYSDGEGAVEWHCVVPRAAVAGGFGYVECLRLTIPPWRLPIRTLRWGRFLSERRSLIWIDWRGDFASRSVFLDAATVSALEVSDDGIALENGGRLRLDRGLTLRSGPLGSTVFRAIPGLERVAPARLFRVEETKWRSRGRFEAPGEAAEEGWCIHEVVKWP